MSKTAIEVIASVQRRRRWTRRVRGDPPRRIARQPEARLGRE
jgi:hypothetical protein